MATIPNQHEDSPTKQCRRCKQVKSHGSFYLSQHGTPRSICKPCNTAAWRQWQIDNPVKLKKSRACTQLRKKYGISLKDYTAILRRQGGKCAICDSDKPGGHGTFHVDHCHATGSVRGLLCSTCNVGLGQFHDNTEKLAKAIKYLEVANG